jgi:homoserine dehydrogenase
MKDIVSKYYISVTALDKLGVLKTITGILNKSNISIESITQKTSSENETVPIIIVTHETTEDKIQKAMKTIDSLEEVKKESNLIRILDN